MITGLEKVSYYPNAKNKKLWPIVSNSSLLKNKSRFAETAPKFGYRPLRKTSDMFGNVVANTKLKGVSGVTNSNLLQTKNTLTESAPKPRVIGKEVQRLMNAGVLPEYMGLQKGPERKEVILLQQMMGNGAKLIALELIRGTLAGKNYKNMISHGNSNQAARAKTQYDQLVHDYSELINRGQQHDKSKVNKLLENFTAQLSRIYRMDMSLPVPERELFNVVNELADIRQASERLFNRNNDSFTQVNASLEEIKQLGAGAQAQPAQAQPAQAQPAYPGIPPPGQPIIHMPAPYGPEYMPAEWDFLNAAPVGGVDPLIDQPSDEPPPLFDPLSQVSAVPVQPATAAVPVPPSAAAEPEEVKQGEEEEAIQAAAEQSIEDIVNKLNLSNASDLIAFVLAIDPTMSLSPERWTVANFFNYSQIQQLYIAFSNAGFNVDDIGNVKQGVKIENPVSVGQELNGLIANQLLKNMRAELIGIRRTKKGMPETVARKRGEIRRVLINPATKQIDPQTVENVKFLFTLNRLKQMAKKGSKPTAGPAEEAGAEEEISPEDYLKALDEPAEPPTRVLAEVSGQGRRKSRKPKSMFRLVK